MNWRSLYLGATSRLGSAMDARRIVEEAASQPWPLLLDEPVSARAAQYYAEMVERRAAGEPLQYVLGRWGFRRLDLMVDRRVLIPRPETEQVVEVALEELRRLEARPGALVVDLGTGSGAIALSMALEGKASVWATDASPDAVANARANLAGLGGCAASRVRLAVGSWWDALPDDLRGSVTMVVSNPPYVATAEMAALPTVVGDWEPATALDAGPTGLEALEVIVNGASDWLTRPGTLVVELAPHQAGAVMALADRAGFASVTVHTDLAGRDRTLVARITGDDPAGAGPAAG